MYKLNAGRAFPLALALLLAAQPAFATDGYFSTGYGAAQQGHGGAGVAAPSDALAPATNPAGLFLAGNRLDLGFQLFRPNRSGAIFGNQLPPGYPDVNGTYDANRVVNFPIPEFGWSRTVSPKLALGIAAYGNGGMNTSYKKPILLLGTTRGGVDLDQFFISPTVSYRLNRRNAVGLSANIVYQRFSVEGLQNFANSTYSTDPAHVTNTGHSNSFGGGVRVGWIGEINRAVSVGATYQSRTWATAFDRYKGLFAEHGKFDVPANFAGGVAIKAGPRATVYADLERILYGSDKSVADSDAAQAQLGSSNGPGFGWRSIDAVKTGADLQPTRGLTLRAGYNHSGQPVKSSQTFFNLLAPAVVQDHLHVGASWRLNRSRELSFAFVHAFSNTVNGSSSIPASAGGGNANLKMYENSFQIGFSSIHE
ncbi:MAG: outer membrane protein transport protein [Terracidiphilus sp.]